MYAAHFAAALTIKARVSRAPTWALLTGAFLPDFLWIALARAGVEPTQARVFFDDWSHSLASVAVMATVFAVLFLRSGRPVVIAVWSAVFSHFLLDLPIHPRYLALFPHSAVHLGIALSAGIGARAYWWVQAAVVLLLAGVYARLARKLRHPANLIFASMVTVVALHLLMFPG